jgi:hypothetical protein
MDQARLEAGHEQRNLIDFDVAALLKEFCGTTRALAAQRNLFLKAEGPGSLIVEGDPAKIQRIVQNLVLNALQVTQQGGVKVSWGAGGNDRRPQWTLCVQDTGPGFERESATPLEQVLKQATTEAHEISHGANLLFIPTPHRRLHRSLCAPLAAGPPAKASDCRSSNDCASCSMPVSSLKPPRAKARRSEWCSLDGTSKRLAPTHRIRPLAMETPQADTPPPMGSSTKAI